MTFLDYFKLPQKDGQGGGLLGASQNPGEYQEAPGFVEKNNKGQKSVG